MYICTVYVIILKNLGVILDWLSCHQIQTNLIFWFLTTFENFLKSLDLSTLLSSPKISSEQAKIFWKIETFQTENAYPHSYWLPLPLKMGNAQPRHVTIFGKLDF